jgi:hypothetical protein
MRTVISAIAAVAAMSLFAPGSSLAQSNSYNAPDGYRTGSRNFVQQSGAYAAVPGRVRSAPAAIPPRASTQPSVRRSSCPATADARSAYPSWMC